MSCCPTTYWCTPDGPVGVEADAGGVFTPPAGATGGPFPTLEEAQEGCPATLSCGSQPDIRVPFRVRATFTGVSGTGCTFQPSAPAYFPGGYFGPMGAEFTASGIPNPTQGNDFQLSYGGCAYSWSLGVGCDPAAPDPTRPFFLIAVQGWCGSAVTAFSAAAGWTEVGSGSAWAVLKRFNAAEWADGALLYGPIGTITLEQVVTFNCSTFDGTFTLGVAPW